MFDADVVTILMVNPKTQNTIKTIVKEGKEKDQKQYSFERTNVIGFVASTNKPFLSRNIKKEPCFKKGVFKKSDIQSVMCFPFQSEGIVTGYILLMNTQGSKLFDSEEFSLLEKFAIIVAPALSNVQKIKDYFLTVLPDESLLTKYESLGLIGKSRQFLGLLKTIEAAARCDVRVLLEGQSGTGKELIARAIHAGSKRAGKPLVAMNCAALPDSLVESELFGYEKGAFTGAMEQKKGKFEYANHSTLFLDEIGDMSLSAQSKLLRVLQDGTFYRVGGNSSFFSDVRIISASNRDLLGLAMNKQFREDLYYRLNVVQIEAPPLRQRGDDIQLLAEYYFDYFNRHYRKSLSGFSDEAMAWLMQHEYPGNVRELKNIIERAIIMERGDRITLASFPKMSAVPSGVASSKSAGLRDLEREHIVAIMREVNFNKSEAARRLGIARKTLREKLQRYNITQI